MSTLAETENIKYILRTENLTIHHPQADKAILEDICLEIPRKAVVRLKGDIGSGKTSLLNVLGFLTAPTSGSIYFADSDIDYATLSRAELDSTIQNYFSYVFQSIELMMHWTALDNMLLPAIAAGYTKKNSQEKIETYCKDFGLESNLLYKRTSTLSGGQKQLVQLIRAIIAKERMEKDEPLVIIADEPTANLTEKRKTNVIKKLIELSEEKDIAIIIATHDDLDVDFTHKYIIENNKVIKEGETK